MKLAVSIAGGPLRQQLSLDMAAPSPAPLDVPELPPLVRAKTLWQPWAGLVAAVPPGGQVGLKSLETRKQRIAPGLLVIYAGLAEDTAWRARLLPRVPAWALQWLDLRGQALALVLIGGSMPLVPEDEERAWFYELGRKAMHILRCWPFKTPFPQNGSQGEFKIPREKVLEALRP